MRVRFHDVVAVAAIVVGAAAGWGLHRMRAPDVRPRTVPAASVQGPTAIRFVEIGPSGVGVVSRAGAPDLTVAVGAEVPVRGDFDATVRVRRHLGTVAVRVEFLRRGVVLGEATISSLRPSVFVRRGSFGVRGI